MPKPKYYASWNDVPLVIDVPMVSIILGLNPQTVKRYLRQGKIKGFKCGDFWRIRKESLIAYMEGESEALDMVECSDSEYISFCRVVD